MTKHSILACLSIAAALLVGCGSSNSALTPDSGTTPTPDSAGLTLYGLTGGDNCYTITAIAAGYSDGCAIGVAGGVMHSLPLNYDGTTAIVTLGRQGSLGGGQITNNQGTLNRDGPTSFTTATGATCTLNQTDTSLLQMLANNQFTISVTEVQSNFGAACGTEAPATDPCTSTWTWTMQKAIDATLTTPLCGEAP